MNRIEMLAAQTKRREDRRPQPKPRQPIQRRTPLKLSTKPLPRSVKPLPKKSKKLRSAESLHSRLKKRYLAEHPICECGRQMFDGRICNELSVDVHHKKGRGEFLNDISTFLAVSRRCHDWIELNPIEAKKLGLSSSRLNK